MKRYWIAVAVIFAAFISVLLLVPTERTAVFWLSLCCTVPLLPLCVVFVARAVRDKDEWPDMGSYAGVQTVMFAYMAVEAERLTAAQAGIAEAVLYGIILVFTFWKSLVRYRKIAIAVLCIALAGRLAYDKLTPYFEYKNAVSLYESGDIDAAESAFTALNGYKDSEYMLKRCAVKRGLALIDQGKTLDAYFALIPYADEPDVTEALNGDLKEYYDIYAAYEPGNTLTFGEWEGEPLTWRVLARDGSKRLLVTEKCVARMAFNGDYEIEAPVCTYKECLSIFAIYGSYSNTQWSGCTLRSWLNGNFMNDAFTSAERDMILLTENANDGNETYGVEGCGTTNDCVFLLTQSDVTEYFTDNKDRSCDAWWWTRTPGCSNSDAVIVYEYGGIAPLGNSLTMNKGGVRPAVWVDAVTLNENGIK